VTGALREACPVPPDPPEDDAVAVLRWLRCPEGAAATQLAGELLTAGVDLLPGLARLRTEVGAEHAGPAWELARLRLRARPVFGADADVLLFTADALEQAGRPELAARRAARLLAGGADSAADLGCAAGTDSIALARAGARVLAVDRDPVARELTASNAEALGLAEEIWVSAGDVTEIVAAARGGEVAGCEAATLDPARRAGGRRQLDPDRWSPPWSTVSALLDRVPTSVVKVAPGLDHDRVPDGVEAEWVSVGGSIVEALLWGRGVSRTWRRATLVRDGAMHELTATADPGTAPVGPVRGWLHEPDPALIRSGLIALVAADLGATLVDPTIAYLSSDGPAQSPWVSSLRIDDVVPFNLKRLKVLLRTRGIGRVVVKKRGSPIEPEALARQLRGPGGASAVVVVTRVAGAPTVLVCDVDG
jgi:SAM-dependent methyltransferase